jgi:hypothetical protein
MRKEGYSETTIERYVRLLKELAKRGDLRDSESVKIGLTQTGWADGTKEMACGAYAIYAKQHGFTFAPPRYRRVEKLPFIPLDSEVAHLSGKGLAKFHMARVVYGKGQLSSAIAATHISCRTPHETAMENRN